jgi:Ca2+-binding RTX toxin-like protein
MSGQQIESWDQTWETITTPQTPPETNSAPDQSGQLDPTSTLEQTAAPDPHADLIEIVMDQSGAIVGGSAGGDLFIGSEARDVAKGLAGDDVFLMGAGDDHVNAGDGDDEMHGGTGNDYLHGFAGYDTAYGGDGNDHIYANLAYGEAGDDQLTGENEIGDTLYGGDGNDKLIGFSGDDSLYGNAGDDVLNGGDGTDVLDGGDGADKLWGGSGNDILLGGTGADLIGGDGGDDFIDGGDGADKLSGGDGDDTFVLDVLDSVHGHSGIDTLLFAEGDASNVELSELDIYSIEAVDMRNGAANTLSLSYRNILQSENDTLIIRGDAEDKVILFETMEHLGTIEMSGETYQHYAFSQWSHYTELYVDTDIQIEFPHSDPDALV